MSYSLIEHGQEYPSDPLRALILKLMVSVICELLPGGVLTVTGISPVKAPHLDATISVTGELLSYVLFPRTAACAIERATY